MDRQRHAALTMRLGQVQQDGSIKILQTFENVDPGAQCPDLVRRPTEALRVPLERGAAGTGKAGSVRPARRIAGARQTVLDACRPPVGRPLEKTMGLLLDILSTAAMLFIVTAGLMIIFG